MNKSFLYNRICCMLQLQLVTNITKKQCNLKCSWITFCIMVDRKIQVCIRNKYKILTFFSKFKN